MFITISTHARCGKACQHLISYLYASIKLTLATALDEAGGDPSGWYIPPWTVELDQAICKDIGVSKAILSVTAPGPVIKKDPLAAAKLARECNEAGAAVRDAHPTQYGFFASLPSLFDTQLAIEEIRYALDELRADGVVIFTRYGQGNNYLGHEAFEPVWAELSRRKAVVFVHPTHPQDTNLINNLLPQPMFDYPHETGRTAMDLITSGRLRQHSGCKVILSHAGGTLPYLIYRAATMLPCMPDGSKRTRQELLDEAKEFYFDTALSSGGPTFSALTEFAKPGHVLFGSDFPNAPRDAILKFSSLFDEHDVDGQNANNSTTTAALALFSKN